eukprot:TRINITY_DN36880_c0_g1_i4.p1 TRINITY_DN36880_c0_g1~~TRINITY_DN36880_c0_g1_i4.p1  ORF type:complete len:634 (-),score=95.50 TRINITY_DN36880_c0_g1_i4:242-2143(-)
MCIRDRSRGQRSAFVEEWDEEEQEGHRELFPLLAQGTTIVDPRSESYQTWENFMGVLLLYTATVTPVDVAVKTDGTAGIVLFWWNRCVDSSFLLDLFINLRLAFYPKHSHQTLVMDIDEIQRRYLRGWFTVDLISVLPLEVIHSDLQVVKLLRLLRLLKLLKVARFEAIVARWQIKFGVPYSTLNLCLNLVVVLLAVHWTACLWFMFMEFESDDETKWISTANSDWTSNNVNANDGYCAALSHAAMTLTTIGYGDIVPANVEERWFSVMILQLFGAWLYAYIIAVSSAIISSNNAESFEFNAIVDSLTDLAEENGLSEDLQVRAKEFLEHGRKAWNTKRQLQLVKRVSISLQTECVETLIGYIDQCPYFKDLGIGFKTQLVLRMIPEAYPPGELVLSAGRVDSMVFVASGIVTLYGSLVVHPGMVGQEAICTCGVQRLPARALTEIHIFRLPRKAILEVLEKFPSSQKALRYHQIRLGFRRGIRLAIEQHNSENMLLRTMGIRTKAALRAKAAFLRTRKKKVSGSDLLRVVRPEGVNTWEDQLDVNALIMLNGKVAELLVLDREIALCMSKLTDIQQGILESYGKVLDTSPLEANALRVSKCVAEPESQKLRELEEQFWLVREELQAHQFSSS